MNKIPSILGLLLGSALAAGSASAETLHCLDTSQPAPNHSLIIQHTENGKAKASLVGALGVFSWSGTYQTVPPANFWEPQTYTYALQNEYMPDAQLTLLKSKIPGGRAMPRTIYRATLITLGQTTQFSCHFAWQ